MNEPRYITLCRHLFLLLFAAISIWPVLTVFSISLRPGNQLQSTELSIITENCTFAAYRQLFTEQPFLKWLGNSLIVSTLVTITGVVERIESSSI